MDLCIDVGNTTVVYVIYQNSDIVASFSYYTHSYHTLDEITAAIKIQLDHHEINPLDINRIIYCSVVPSLDSYMFDMIGDIFKVEPLILKPGIKTGLQLSVDNPLEVGGDIIADCVAAKEKYGFPILIVDLGTASKVLYVDGNGAFSAACITPGVDISRTALSSKAALLPEVGFKKPMDVTKCKNTIDCMNTGLILSHAYGVRGIVDEYKKIVGENVKVILTGGASTHLKDYLNDYIYEPHLLHEGLLFILNKQKVR